jgi:hypothetical protein
VSSIGGPSGDFVLALFRAGGTHFLMTRPRRFRGQIFGCGEEDRIGVGPFARGGGASGRWTLEPHVAASAVPLGYENLPASNRLMASRATALVIKRTPETEFIKEPKNIEFIFPRQA